MASVSKSTQQLARQLYKLSFDGDSLSAERVSGVLEYVAKHRPAQPVALLRAYQRLVAAEIARRQAIVEHAGPIDERVLADIASAMSRRYGRSVTAVGRRHDALLAGLRVRVGDDVFESSVAGQLAGLAAAV